MALVAAQRLEVNSLVPLGPLSTCRSYINFAGGVGGHPATMGALWDVQ